MPKRRKKKLSELKKLPNSVRGGRPRLPTTLMHEDIHQP